MARKILLADDSVTAQNMGRKILSDAGYDVVTVNNGSAALKRVTEQKPDLIVLDVYMPGYSGLEVCQRLKDSPDTEAIPILLTVGKLEPFKPEEARRVRAEAYIVKPFEASELLSVLTRLEDQIVPGRGNGKAESHGDSDTGWKNRLRFPSKKKKEEAEPEPGTDLVGKSATRGTRRAPVPIASAEKNGSTAAIPDIPRDITPEELDALSALAAKLDGESSQNAAPAEKVSSAAEVATAAEATQVAVDSPPPAEIAPTEPTPAAAEAKPFEVVPVRVETLAETEPAPVDRSDEPMFVNAVAANEPLAPETLEAKEEAAVAEQAPSADTATPVEAQAKAEETKALESVEVEKEPVSATPAEAPKVEIEPAATTAGAVQTQEEQEGSAPSEEELAEALRLLTPSAADSSSMPSQETLAAAGAALAKEAAQIASTPAQWMAVAVAVDPEEAVRSLEAEMFQTMTRPAEGSSTPNDPAGNESVAVNVGTRQESTEKIEDRAMADEPAGVTFADAVARDDEPNRSAEVTRRAAAEVGLPQASGTTSSTNAVAGGGEAMGKEQGKNGKSNWHQIRSAAPAAKDAVETAKQAEEAPKAMAAAADGARLAPTDPTAIANIVDSVLADLRPKIVEEISKKLAGK